MEILSEIEEKKEDITGYVKQIVALEMEIKAIKEDLKQIKKDAAEEGLIVKDIDYTVAQVKRRLKKTPDELSVIDKLEEVITEDQDLVDSISLVIQ